MNFKYIGENKPQRQLHTRRGTRIARRISQRILTISKQREASSQRRPGFPGPIWRKDCNRQRPNAVNMTVDWLQNDGASPFPKGTARPLKPNSVFTWRNSSHLKIPTNVPLYRILLPKIQPCHFGLESSRAPRRRPERWGAQIWYLALRAQYPNMSRALPQSLPKKARSSSGRSSSRDRLSPPIAATFFIARKNKRRGHFREN